MSVRPSSVVPGPRAAAGRAYFVDTISVLVVEMIGDPNETYTIHWPRDVPSLPARACHGLTGTQRHDRPSVLAVVTTGT